MKDISIVNMHFHVKYDQNYGTTTKPQNFGFIQNKIAADILVPTFEFREELTSRRALEGQN